MTIPIISRTNTIDEWRIQTNQEATALNTLETGAYVKSNGSLTFTNTSSLILTSEGTSLQVANSALVQKDVTVGQNILVGTESAQTGNVAIGNVLTVLGKDRALIVANNAMVNVDMQVVRTIYTGNVSANGNLTVGGNETVNGVMRLNGTGNVLFVNLGSSYINTSSIQTLTSNATNISYAIIGDESVATSRINTGNILSASIQTLSVTGNETVAGTLGVTGNTISGNLVTTGLTQTGTLRSTGRVDITSTLDVTGNVTSGNIVTTGLTHTNTLRTTGRADIGGSLVAGTTTLGGTSITGNLDVTGNLTITGPTNFDSNIIVLRSVTPQPNGSGFSYLGVNRGNTSSVSGTANANAYIRWNEPDYQWEVRDVLNTNDSTAYSRILTANLISSSLTSISTGTLATSNAANILNSSINTTLTHANSSYTHANGAFGVANSASSYANGAFGVANSASSYANSAYLQANTATTNAATADQKAVSAGSYANSAYAHANTRLSASGGTINGSLVVANNVTVSGNLTVSGSVTYINTTELNIGDNIINLNADVSPSTSPSENAGVSINRGSSVATNLLWNETTDRWTFTNDGTNYSNIGSSAAEIYANSAYALANTVNINDTASRSYANSAYTQANTATTNAAIADQRAVTSGSYANSAFGVANTAAGNATSAGSHATSAYNQANTASLHASSGYNQANTTTLHAIAAFNKANAAASFSTTSGSATTAGTATYASSAGSATVASFAVTQAAGTNNTSIATTAFVSALITAKGYISFQPSTGGVWASRNLSVVRNAAGNFTIVLAAGIQNGTDQYAPMVGAINKGQIVAMGFGPDAMDVYGVGITSVSAGSFTVVSTRNFDGGIGFYGGGNDGNNVHNFETASLDPARITVVVF
jgi:cytoskeletal protein CcmA (bactofilin family)